MCLYFYFKYIYVCVTFQKQYLIIFYEVIYVYYFETTIWYVPIHCSSQALIFAIIKLKHNVIILCTSLTSWKTVVEVERQIPFPCFYLDHVVLSKFPHFYYSTNCLPNLYFLMKSVWKMTDNGDFTYFSELPEYQLDKQLKKKQI